MSHNADQQSEEDENEWFFDIILNFMKSPRWKTPVHSFIDENCIVFDNEDENKFEYSKIHEDFKKIVEDLLGELLAEFDITQEQFLEAFQKAQKNPLHKRIVDQIISVDNFMAFKRMMAKRNNDLNKKAMELMLKQERKKQKLIEQQRKLELEFAQQHLAKSQPGNKSTLHGNQNQMEEQFDADLKRALTESQNLENQRKQEMDEEEELIKRAMEMSVQEEQQRVKRHESMKQEEEQKLLEKIREISIQEEKEKQLQERLQQQKEYERLNSQHLENLRQSEILSQQQTQKAAKEDSPKKEEPKNSKGNEKMEVEEEKKELQQEQPEKKKQKRVGGGYALPSLASKKDANFDQNILRDQRDKILKNFNEFDMVEGSQETSQSMKDMFIQQREKTEEILNQASPIKESVEERRRRLRAHRDLLVQKNNEKRKDMLNTFNDTTNKAQQQLDTFKEIDRRFQEKQAKSNQMNLEDLDNEDRNLDVGGMDKRLEMYRKMKEQILSDMESSKKLEQLKKMEDIQKKIEALERAKKQKEDQEKALQEHLKEKEELRRQKHKGFLQGIKTYMIEDI